MTKCNFERDHKEIVAQIWYGVFENATEETSEGTVIATQETVLVTNERDETNP